MAVMYESTGGSFPFFYVGFGLLVSFVLYRLGRLLLYPLWAPLSALPGPPRTSFLWGNLTEIFKSQGGALHEAWANEFGPTYRYAAMFGHPRLCTLDTRAVGYILSNAYMYPKPGQARRNLAQTLGEGLLVAEGDVHKRQRRIMNPSFSPAQIRELTPIFFDKVSEMRDIWQKQLDLAGGEELKIDICKWMSRATLDIIGLAGFGYSFNTLNDQNNELALAFNHLFTFQRPTLFAMASNVVPILRLIPNRRTKALAHSMATMRRIGMELVRRKKDVVRQTLDGKRSDKEIEKSHLAGRDLLTALVRANMATDIAPAHQLSDEEVLAQISTFLLAGHETTSTAVTWSLYALSQDMNVQTKLREELLSVSEETPSMDDLNALPYLDMFVREVMRFHAPVSNTIRVAAQDDSIPLNVPYVDRSGVSHDSIRVKAGDGVFIAIRTINRLKSLWGPDAGEFNPERWRDLSADATAIPGVWSHMMSFLGGPRACIGYRFSIIEIKAFLFTLVRAFTIEMADPSLEIEPRSTIVTRPIVKGQADKGPQLPLLLKPVGKGQ